MTIYTRHQTPPTPADPPGPAGLWMPWHTGLGDVCKPCPVPTLPCNVCSSGEAPQYLRASVTGLTNNSCPDCASLNGDYILESTGNLPGLCRWYLYFSPVIGCNIREAYITLQYNAPNVWLTFGFNANYTPGRFGASWWKVFSGVSQIDCDVLDEELTLVGYHGDINGQQNGCLISGSTVRIIPDPGP